MLGNKTILITEGARTLAVGHDAVSQQAVRLPLLLSALWGRRRCHTAHRDLRADPWGKRSCLTVPQHCCFWLVTSHLSLGAPSPCNTLFATELLPSVSFSGGVRLVGQWSGHPPVFCASEGDRLPVHVLGLKGSYFRVFFFFLFGVCGFILACVRFAFILAQVPWPGGLCLSTFTEEQLRAVYLWNVSGRSKQLNLQHGSLIASAATSRES